MRSNFLAVGTMVFRTIIWLIVEFSGLLSNDIIWIKQSKVFGTRSV